MGIADLDLKGLAKMVKSVTPRIYWILLVKEEGQWAMEFGDYSKSVVTQERRDYLDSRVEFKAADVKVRACLDTQEEIDKCVRAHNEGRLN